MRLEEFFVKYSRGRGVTIAESVARTTRRLLSRRDPLPPARAIPGAPPRLRSGRLRGSVKVHRTIRGARVVVWAPYAGYLEPIHPFLSVAMKQHGLRSKYA